MRLLITILLISLAACSNHVAETIKEKPTSSTRSGGHSTGLPAPKYTLPEGGMKVDFSIDPDFPVPSVTIQIDNKKTYRFAFDTGNSGAFFIKQNIAEELNLPIVGKAFIGDLTGHNRRAVNLVKIESLILGNMEFKDVIGVSGEGSENHTRNVPDSFDGILGLGLAKELVVTLNYRKNELLITNNNLNSSSKNTIQADFASGIAKISTDLAGQPESLYIDSGHRNTITVPSTQIDKYPTVGNLEDLAPLSTMTNDFTRKQAPLKGNFNIAGFEIEQPLVAFTEGPPLYLIGYEILKNFSITLDQSNGLVQFKM